MGGGADCIIIDGSMAIGGADAPASELPEPKSSSREPPPEDPPESEFEKLTEFMLIILTAMRCSPLVCVCVHSA